MSAKSKTKKRRVLRGKITRSINRLYRHIDDEDLDERSAEKELKDLREDFNKAVEINSELYDYEEHSKLDIWETELIRDLHEIEIDVEDYLRKRSVPPIQREAAKTLEVEDGHEKSNGSIDIWIDRLKEYEETKLEKDELKELSVAEALCRLEESRNIPQVKLMIFDGSPLKYVEFIECFHIHIHKKANLSDDQRMMQLKMALTGDAARSISGLGTSGVMYATALKTLKELYGQKSVIARAFISKLIRGEKLSNRQTLRVFSIEVVNCLATLRRINFLADVNSTETLRQIIRRLPDHLIQRWKRRAADLRERDELPNLQHVSDFLNREIKAEFDPDFGDLEKGYKVPDRKVINATQRQEFKCCVCSGSHRLYNCPTFIDSSVKEKTELIKQHRLCYSCLNKGHITRDCRSRKACGKNGCMRTHHPLIHVDPPSASGASTLDQASILPVVRVKFRSPTGRIREGNVLIDGGAGTTIIRRDFAIMLGLQGRKEQLEICVVGGEKHHSKNSRRVKFWISQLDGGEEFPMEAYELDKTVMSVPPLNREWLSSFEHLKDIDFPHKAGPIDLILGVQNSHLHADQEIREGLPYQPVGKKTKLGWCALGSDINVNQISSIGFCQKIEHPNLEKMYDMETVGVRAPNCDCPMDVLSKDDRSALNLLETSCKKEGDRYTIGLPWKSDPHELPNNYSQALGRLVNLEKSLLKDSKRAKLYSETMDGYIKNGWAEKLEDHAHEKAEDVSVYYLPHHGVYRLDKPSTPLRIVFDPASTFQGVSLNSCLYRGPSLLGDLLGILLRFRERPIAFQGDISKMFLQIRLPEPDTQMHRFLWRNLDVNREPDIYRLLRVTFGDKSSPDMANFVMLKIASEHESSHPKASEVLKNDRYMDDIIHSCESVEQAKTLTNDLDTILDTGSFKIKKWYVSKDNRQKADMVELVDSPKQESEEKVKTLGVLWNCISDFIHFQVNIQTKDYLTKRIVLSRLSTIFDPLGLATVTTIRARVEMQNLWRHKHLGWDDKMSEEDNHRWCLLFKDLQDLNAISVERCLKPYHVSSVPELHVFCDASQTAYGACVYILWETPEKRVTYLLASKARVAPMKQTTVPRLELMGALIGSRLAKTVYTELRDKPHVFLWTDSQIVLRWLHSESTGKKAFVGVRIAEIQAEWDITSWKFVPTKLNPADALSRGVKVKDIPTQWFYGPSFLCKRENWPDQSVCKSEESDFDVQEDKVTRKCTGTLVCAFQGTETKSLSFIDSRRFSSWPKLLRVTAYCLRFVHNLKEKYQERVLSPCLLPEEIKSAEIEWVKEAQKDIQNWQSTYSEFSPFVENGVIRVGGRLRNCPLTYERVHPVLLTSSNPITKLLLMKIHEDVLHAGVERTLAESRRKYWIIRGRNAVKNIVKHCVVCRKLRKPVHSTFMSDLPSERLKIFSPPYSTTAVDLFGPFYLRYGRNKKIKAWGAVFTCATVRAVHLEIVESLSTSSFLHALRRFVSHHGWPSTVISDNGSSFIGTKRELREIIPAGRKEIVEFSSQHDMKWIFTTPRSPHQGGVFESMVKQAKNAIKVSIGEQCLSWNEMATVFSEVESLLNSRPLGYCSNDPNDPQPLTPNHFMMGRASVHIPEDLSFSSGSLGRRYDFVQTILTHIWKRFVREYIPTIIQRMKWKTRGRQFKPGDIVLVADYQCPRGKWPLARVTEVYPGKDGIIRNVQVKTQYGTYKRAVQKCCLVLESTD